MWDNEILKQKLEQLKFIKNASNRNIEFWCPSYTDTQNTKFEDTILKRDKIVDIILDTAIKYLEEKIKKFTIK